MQRCWLSGVGDGGGDGTIIPLKTTTSTRMRTRRRGPWVGPSLPSPGCTYHPSPLVIARRAAIVFLLLSDEVREKGACIHLDVLDWLAPLPSLPLSQMEKWGKSIFASSSSSSSPPPPPLLANLAWALHSTLTFPLRAPSASPRRDRSPFLSRAIFSHRLAE